MLDKWGGWWRFCLDLYVIILKKIYKDSNGKHSKRKMFQKVVMGAVLFCWITVGLALASRPEEIQ